MPPSALSRFLRTLKLAATVLAESHSVLQYDRALDELSVWAW
jgi:hypothetical protein